MYYIYILKCADDTLYVGSTKDLEGRVYRHNNSKSGAHYTKTRRPVTLVYNEQFDTKSEALKREIKIKSWKRQKKLDLFMKKA